MGDDSPVHQGRMVRRNSYCAHHGAYWRIPSEDAHYKEKYMKKVSVVLVCLAFLLPVILVWCWAFGMVTLPVFIASVFSFFFLIFTAALVDPDKKI